MMYKGENSPRGYEYGVPQSRGGSSTNPQPGPQQRLPDNVLSRIRDSVSQDPQPPKVK